MTQPATQDRFSPPWLLIVGLLLGGALVVFMVMDSASNPFKKQAVASSANVVELTEENWQKEVVASKVPVVVDFWAPWCGPCLRFSPTVDKLADQYVGKVKVAKLNVDDGKRIATKYGIQTIPHILIFKGGEEPRQSIDGGRLSEAVLNNAIQSLLAE